MRRPDPTCPWRVRVLDSRGTSTILTTNSRFPLTISTSSWLNVNLSVLSLPRLRHGDRERRLGASDGRNSLHRVLWRRQSRGKRLIRHSGAYRADRYIIERAGDPRGGERRCSGCSFSRERLAALPLGALRVRPDVTGSARSTRSAPGPAVRPLWLPDGLPDRGPLATVLQRSEVRHSAEPPRRTAIRLQEKREEKYDNDRRVHDMRAERSRLLIERRNARCVIPSDVPYHLSGQRVLETSSVDFAGNVVVPELPPVPVAATPADTMLLLLGEDHLRNRVHQQTLRVPDQDLQPAVHCVMHSLPSDKSSVIAQIKLRISEPQS